MARGAQRAATEQLSAAASVLAFVWAAWGPIVALQPLTCEVFPWQVLAAGVLLGIALGPTVDLLYLARRRYHRWVEQALRDAGPPAVAPGLLRVRRP